MYDAGTIKHNTLTQDRCSDGVIRNKRTLCILVQETKYNVIWTEFAVSLSLMLVLQPMGIDTKQEFPRKMIWHYLLQQKKSQHSILRKVNSST